MHVCLTCLEMNECAKRKEASLEYNREDRLAAKSMSRTPPPPPAVVAAAAAAAVAVDQKGKQSPRPTSVGPTYLCIRFVCATNLHCCTAVILCEKEYILKYEQRPKTGTPGGFPAKTGYPIQISLLQFPPHPILAAFLPGAHDFGLLTPPSSTRFERGYPIVATTDD